MSTPTTMTSIRPYIIRAYYDWIVENRLTPFLKINAKCAYVEVPEQFVERGQIILNIAPMAVEGLKFDNHAIYFRARFGAMIENIYIPIPAVLALYAKENPSEGVFFDKPDDAPPRPREVTVPLSDGKKRTQVSHLKIVKSNHDKTPHKHEEEGSD